MRNVSKKKLSIANILSRIIKTSASNLDPWSLEKELHQMTGKGWQQQENNKVTLKLDVETTLKDTHIAK